MSRGWTWINENNTDALYDEFGLTVQGQALEAEIEVIVGKMNDVIKQDEHRRWTSEYKEDEDRQYEEEDDEDSEAQVAARNAADNIAYKIKQDYWSSLESMLHDRGARLMRPYEHWNEDEAYMAYAERDRDDY